MKIILNIKQVQDYAKRVRAKGKTIGFVPTMGYLHKGHLSLIRQAHKDCDIVIISIYVNPTQFGPKEDLKKYPRDLKRDKKLARSAGVDVIFLPTNKIMYPDGFLTYVDIGKITEVLCGASRPGHFRGVATIVSKLCNIIQPDIAYFGQKDAQQARVIQKMVHDLNFSIKIKVMPIIREHDGIAMSSRNKYLSTKERKNAVVLYQSLKLAKKLIKQGQKNTKIIKSRMKSLILAKQSAKIDYVSIVDSENLTPIKRVKKGSLIAVAVKIGKTRLVDNIVVG